MPSPASVITTNRTSPDGIIDLRSDTVTKPSPAMREAMKNAEVGDDVLGDEPTVSALQEKAAQLLGKQAALYVPSGTMANLCAIRSQCDHGDEIIAHDESHFYFYETAAFAAIAGCSVRFTGGPRGQFTADDVRRLVRPDSIHFARSRMVIIENTHNRGGGSIWPVEAVAQVTGAAREFDLKCHMDGARLMNACIATGRKATDYTQHFDTVSMCFSKGLGAPVGSVVAGDRATIDRAKRFRKMFGGAMRQSGIIAAAAIYALEHNIERLAEDHANAKAFAREIAGTPGLSVNTDEVETNMVFFDVVDRQHLGTGAEFAQRLEAQAGVRTIATGPQRIRAVFHLDVSEAQTSHAGARVRELAAGVL